MASGLPENQSELHMIESKLIKFSKHPLPGYPSIATFELIYPRFIHSELMTHRVLSRNAASSRAIPIEAVIKAVRSNPATPSHWGKNQGGMQAIAELSDVELQLARDEWVEAANSAAKHSERLAQIGCHKQIANRVTEPFVWMKTLVTATSDNLQNFFWLRHHKDAQPEFRILAERMYNELEHSHSIGEYEVLQAKDWHAPYSDRAADEESRDYSSLLRISASCCAQVSYRKLDDTLEKANNIFARLVESWPVHASPLEHQARPIMSPHPRFWHTTKWRNERGISGIRFPSPHGEGLTGLNKAYYISGNFSCWTQYRQLFNGHENRKLFSTANWPTSG